MKTPQVLRHLAAGRQPARSRQPPATTGRLGEQDAFRVIRDAIVAVLEVPAAGVTVDTRLVEDLHADSLALVEIVELVEEKLAEEWPGLVPASFRLEDAGLEELRTVGDAVTYAVTSL
jgi:acyl carrier protein